MCLCQWPSARLKVECSRARLPHGIHQAISNQPFQPFRNAAASPGTMKHRPRHSAQQAEAVQGHNWETADNSFHCTYTAPATTQPGTAILRPCIPCRHASCATQLTRPAPAGAPAAPAPAAPAAAAGPGCPSSAPPALGSPWSCAAPRPPPSAPPAHGEDTRSSWLLCCGGSAARCPGAPRQRKATVASRIGRTPPNHAWPAPANRPCAAGGVCMLATNSQLLPSPLPLHSL